LNPKTDHELCGHGTRGDNGIQFNGYAPISIAVTRSGEIAILVTGQYLACGDCSSIVNPKAERTTVISRKS
jgi:hypothetical protein